MMSGPSLEAARKVKGVARDLASRVAIVTGVGIARVADGYAVKVNLKGTVPVDLPHQIDGVRVVYENTGPARAQG